MHLVNHFDGLRYPVARPRDEDLLYFEEVEMNGQRWYKIKKDSNVLFPVDRLSIDEVYMVREAILQLIYGY